MSVWRTEWNCCGDVSETEDWVPDQCPFCHLLQMERDRAKLVKALQWYAKANRFSLSGDAGFMAQYALAEVERSQ